MTPPDCLRESVAILMSKELNLMTVNGDVNDGWQRFVAAKRADELARIITEVTLKPAETDAFVEAPSETAPSRRPAPRLDHIETGGDPIFWG